MAGQDSQSRPAPISKATREANVGAILDSTCELAQKRTEANLDAAHARPIVSSAPIRKEG